ncbi:MAG: ATP-dependent protease subunit HslV [Gemmatimonadota bacterium]|nr:HslU--HslV peptidase proteolytic subunit [Gemmatimonadota bacterium]MDP6461146.1 ATP-dependent protease subunit HslV [Gemmatimonadota bacterium]MDP6528560.1 ATP-dependent protease subunit HslV [Gemmatimonadota bacterium]MDP6801919.1 ATP-dependent protease subunit HslV [Gemmatimonadota bacterium]MDP7032340.1 ATP-dependent protease subunit HslV [Gemmatimonadota bacterium]
MTEAYHGTTILGVRTKSGVALAGDGQVTLGHTVVKRGAVKVRRLEDWDVLCGFSGSAADAFALFSKFEKRLSEFNGRVHRAAVELAQEWRSDRILRKLEALLAVMDREHSLILSGSGDVIEPDDGLVAVGSGGSYALAAARAYCDAGKTDAADIARDSLHIAAGICIYTNDQIEVVEL